MYKVVTYWNEDKTKILNFCKQCHNLWNEHLAQTRSLIIRNKNNFDNPICSSDLIFKNIKEIEILLKNYYNKDYIEKYTSFLESNAIMIEELCRDGLDDENLKLIFIQNTNNIIHIMNEINPFFWNISKIQPIWYSYANNNFRQIYGRNIKNWSYDFEAYNSNHKIIGTFSDIFAKGIINQNIEQFADQI